MSKVVVTGFGPFNGVPENPSSKLIELIDKDQELGNGVVVATKVLETSMEGVHEGLEEIDARLISMELEQESCVYVHLGVYASESKFRLECQAFNEATFRCPDERGNRPDGVPIVPNQPSILYSNLDLDMLCERLQKDHLTSRFPVAVTNDPGRFVCNYVYYQSLYQHRNVVFVHVPGEQNMSVEEQFVFIKYLLGHVDEFVIPNMTIPSELTETVVNMGFSQEMCKQAFFALNLTNDLNQIMNYLFDATDQQHSHKVETYEDLISLRQQNGMSFDEEVKVVVVVNGSLNMKPGKIAAQVGHAVLALFRGLAHDNPGLLQTWELMGEPIIVCKAETQGVLSNLKQQASSSRIPCFPIHDAGRTQVAAGSQTVVAFGPAKRSTLDQLTGHLKLL